MSSYLYSLRAGRSGDRIPVGVWSRFSAPVQTGPVLRSTSCSVGTGSRPGTKWAGREIGHAPPSSSEVKENVELYLYSPSGPSWAVLGRILSLMVVANFINGRGILFGLVTYSVTHGTAKYRYVVI